MGINVSDIKDIVYITDESYRDLLIQALMEASKGMFESTDAWA